MESFLDFFIMYESNILVILTKVFFYNCNNGNEQVRPTKGMLNHYYYLIVLSEALLLFKDHSLVLFNYLRTHKL